MTLFKSTQLIANSGDADKVVFLLDRIELSIQSLDEYRGFAGDDDSIQDTQHTAILVSKLKSSDPNDRLIVTSIQKMSNINVQNGITQSEIDAIGRKRLVFKSHVKEARNDDAYGYVIYVPLMGQPCKAGSMGVYIYISAWWLVACFDVKGKS